MFNVKTIANVAKNAVVAGVQVKYGLSATLAANAASRTLMRPDESVQSMTFARALDLCAGESVLARLERLEEECRTSSDHEECAALKGERLGRIGVYVKGEVTAAFSTDVGAINICGKKIATGLADLTAIRSLVRTANDFDKKGASSTPWCEVWVKPRSIVGLWVTESLMDERPQLVHELEERGYAVEVVSDEDIISNGVEKAQSVQGDRLGFGYFQGKLLGEGALHAFFEGMRGAQKEAALRQ